MRRCFVFALLASGCGSAVEVSPGSGSGGSSGEPTSTGGPSSTAGPTTDSVGTGSSDSASTSGVTTDGTAGLCANMADCDDGEFCNGAEACDPQSPDANAEGCVAGSAPCMAPDVCDESTDTCLTPCQQDPDVDDDGFDSIECGGTDCDDTNADIRPDATEVCNAVDEDCDPSSLAGAEGDVDDDGLVSNACCNPDTSGGSQCGLDCDDSTGGVPLGTWFDCEICGTDCGTQQACENGACINARRVFVTDATFDANMGGESGADGECQDAADDANLGGTWRAFIIQTAAGLNRHAQADLPYIRLDGVRVADSFADLADGTLAAPLEVSETLQTVNANVWTGMSDPNTAGSVDCQNWTSTEFGCLDGGPCGAAGQSANTDTFWDGWYIYHCTQTYRLYCIEQ